jgi:hypothetical protein
MRRFQLPAFYAVIAAVSLPFAGGFAESAPPEPASPALPQSSAILEQQGKHDTVEPRATDLRRQVSDLHDLASRTSQAAA